MLKASIPTCVYNSCLGMKKVHGDQNLPETWFQILEGKFVSSTNLCNLSEAEPQSLMDQTEMVTIRTIHLEGAE